jgi:excinuclease ABC subunit B
MRRQHLFKLHAEFSPAGDQPEAIAALVEGLRLNQRFQTLLGVTGSGKTFTLANVIQCVQRPALVISHNKTLAAQLYSELKSFFPENAVEYFVSYYDYYQPEAYIPQTDTYIAKDASINDELEKKLRLAATSSLLERSDVIVVCSVSCLYGLGSPKDFEAMQAHLVINGTMERDDLLRRLVDIQYTRNDTAPERGAFRAVGDTLDIYPSYRDDFVRVEFWGDTIERLSRRDALTHELIESLDEISVFPAKHFVMPQEQIKKAEKGILAELDEQVGHFERAGRLVEAQRIYQRTQYDLEMLREIGYCQGIENYSRHLAAREPGSRPSTLIDYFPQGFITIVDESHVTLPQIHAMYRADRNRKLVLVEHGFRLPSALDNRPLNFEEYEALQQNILFVSATPGTYELTLNTPVQQVMRPTGLLDPEVEVRPLTNQIDDVIHEIRERAAKGERTLVTTLTKRSAEDLSDYLRKLDIRSRYLHSEVDAIERVDILRSLRAGDFDCLVGINLLREGLDLPEVSLVAVLDADKEGFLRSETSLMQTAGRAARNANGKVILYGDSVTASMRRVLDITRQRRLRQEAFNRERGITPTTVRRAIQSSLRRYDEAEEQVTRVVAEAGQDYNVVETVRQLEKEMIEAAEALEFERAAMLRDQIRSLQEPAASTTKPAKPAKPARTPRRR